MTSLLKHHVGTAVAVFIGTVAAAAVAAVVAKAPIGRAMLAAVGAAAEAVTLRIMVRISRVPCHCTDNLSLGLCNIA